MRSYNIAHFGAFDIDSLGDSMFAKVFDEEIRQRINVSKIVLFSLNEVSLAYNNNSHIYSFSQFEKIHEEVIFDAVVIGGGELLHFNKLSFNSNNLEEEVVYNPGDIWMIPIMMAKKANLPIVFNSIGISNDFSEYEKNIVFSYCYEVSLIALRDRFSAHRLENTGIPIEKIKVVGDTLWLLNKYYPIELLKKEKSKVLLEKEYKVDKNYIIFQYGTLYKHEEAAEAMLEIRNKYKLDIVLLPVNHCHDDLMVLRKINDYAGDKFILIEEKLQPIQIMSLIAGAYAFVGTSLHGNLTAILYGVKSLAIDMYISFVSKIDGMFDMFELGEYVVAQPIGIQVAFEKLINDDVYFEVVNRNLEKVQLGLEIYFNEVANTIVSKVKYGSIDYNAIMNTNNYEQIFFNSFMKSYIVTNYSSNELITTQYSFAELIDGKYRFLFDFNESINLKDANWCLEISTPRKLKIISCFCGKKRVFPLALNATKTQDGFDVFGSLEIKYNLPIECYAVKIEVICEVSDLSFEEKISVMALEIGNKTAWVQLLLQAERNYKNEITTSHKTLETTQGTLKMTQEILEATQVTLETTQVKLETTQETLEMVQKTLETTQKKLENEKDLLNNTKKDLDLTKRDYSIAIKYKEELSFQLLNMQKEFKNKQGHIELLLCSDRELERIKSSRSWRYMGYIWQVKDWFVPVGSKRRLFLKVTVRFIKHPLKFIRKFTPSRIRNFFYYLRKEGAISVSKRFDECLVDTNIEAIKIEVINLIEGVNKKSTDYEKIVFIKPEKPVVSIIIPVFNQFDYTYNCLKSILQNSGDVEYEIIIANDCSTDLTKYIEDIVSNIRVINNDVNLRFLKNSNNAAKCARGKYILFLNNDTQVQENWLAPLVKLIESDKKIGMVGSKLIYPDGRLQEAGGILWNDGSAWNYGNKSDPNDPEFNYVKEVDYISGASIMITRELWHKIGGFDELFTPAYCEDSDLAFEVREHGYKVMYQPLSIVVHFEGVSNGTETNGGQKEYQKINQDKLYEKWENILKYKNFDNGENVFLARDRSSEKNTILMIDHYVPQFDKDAGSRTVFQYLKLFVELGFNVKFIGDNFYPHEPYTEILQQLGIEVLYGSYYEMNWKEWFKENSKFIDFIFLNRPHITEKYIDFIKENTNKKIVYYGHDLHFLREIREYELTNNKELLRSSEMWKRKELNIMKKVDVVLYPSPVEVDTIKKLNRDIDVRQLPAYIVDIDYDTMKLENKKDILFVGGFGHKPNVDGVLWFSKEIFPKVVERYPDIIFYIAGSNVTSEIKFLEEKNIKVLGFVTDNELSKLYKSCKISVAPLRYGAGIKGKIIEAVSKGIQVVSTTCGAEGLPNADKFIPICDTSNEFVDCLINLYNDNSKISINIEEGYKFIEKFYSKKGAEAFIRELFVK